MFKCKWKINGLVEGGVSARWINGSVDIHIKDNLWRIKLNDIVTTSAKFSFMRKSTCFQLTSNIKAFQHQNQKRVIIKLMTNEEIHMQDLNQQEIFAVIKLLDSASKSKKDSNVLDFTNSSIKVNNQPISPILSNRNNFPNITSFVDDNDENNFIHDSPKLTSSTSKQSLISSAQMKASAMTPCSFYSDHSDSTPFSPRNTNTIPKRKPGLMPDNLQDLKRPKMTRSFLSRQTTIDQVMKVQNHMQGFSNLGNTCYMNSILQSLFCLDTFAADLNNVYRLSPSVVEQSQYLLHVSLGRLLQSSLIKHKQASNREQLLADVKESICKTARRFSGNEQHDAYEFLGQLLDQLKDEVDKMNQSNLSNMLRSQLLNPTTLNFESTIKQKIICLNCAFEHEMSITQNDVLVNVPPLNKVLSIQDCLRLYLEETNVDFTCEKCSHNGCRVSYRFSKVPRVLIILLKRYQYSSSTSTLRKVASHISIPKFISLGEHCGEDTMPPMSAPPPCREFSFKSYNQTKESLEPRCAFSDKSNQVFSNTKNFSKTESPSLISQKNVAAFPFNDFAEVSLANMTEEEQIEMAMQLSRNELTPQTFCTPQKNVNKQTMNYDTGPPKNSHDRSMYSSPIFQNSLSCESRKQLFSSPDSSSKNPLNEVLAERMSMEMDLDKENVEPAVFESNILEGASLNEETSWFDSIGSTVAPTEEPVIQKEVVDDMIGPHASSFDQFDADTKKAIELSLSMNCEVDIDDFDLNHNIEVSDKVTIDSSALIQDNYETGNLPYSYQLVSVVSHLGLASNVGHYVADIYDARHNKWHLCDDSHVTITSEEQVRKGRSNTGYIFFYLDKNLIGDLEQYYKTNEMK